MSDETQVAETEAPQEGLVNFQQEQEVQTEDPIPVHEQPEDASFNDVDDDEPLERPDYYPQKFWDEDGPDVENLAKSYAELEKAFKAGKHKVPEDGYNMEDLVDRGLDLEDPTVQAYQEWAQKYGISQQAFEELAGSILEISGDADAAKRNALALSLNNADSINAMVKFIQGYTNEGIPTEPVVATPEMNVQDLRQAIADPRWTSDPVWRTKIEQQWAAANS